MKKLVGGRCYKLGELVLVAHQVTDRLWELCPLSDPTTPVFLVRHDLLFRNPDMSADPRGRTTEDLGEIWTDEELFEESDPATGPGT